MNSSQRSFENRFFNINTANIVVVTGIILTLLFCLVLFKNGWTFWGEGELKMDATGQFGDFIGGVIGTLISFTGFIFLYITLVEQRKTFSKERFETRFFEMLELHRKNVEELSYTTKKLIREVKKKEYEIDISKGRKFFKTIDYDFHLLFEELEGFFKCDISEVYNFSYLLDQEENPNLKGKEINLLNFARIDITYCILFLGLGKQDRLALIELFKPKYNILFITKVIAFASLKPKRESKYYASWKNFDSTPSRMEVFEALYGRPNHLFVLNNISLYELFSKIINSIDDKKGIKSSLKFARYYGGHQFRLGHYFRHLFQIVNFINKNSELSYEEKYSNIKLLRSQLSTFEQKIIFFNSLSSFGRIWELEKSGSTRENIDLQNGLITKYNIIKNIPSSSLINSKILISDYYPEVLLEINTSHKSKERRKELEKLYA